MSLNDMRKTLAGFWGGFLNREGEPPKNTPIPAWQDGYVPPEDADAYPRITYDLAGPEFGDFAILSASIWDRRQQVGFFGLVDDVLLQAAEKIPPVGGILLRLERGTLWVRRGNPFSHYLDDPDDQHITRGIMRVVVSLAQ